MTTGAAEFQGVLVQLSDRLAIESKKVTGALARLDQRDALRYVTDAYPEVASPYLAAAGDLSATWYEDQATTTAGKLFVAKPAPLPTADQLAANGRWSLLQKDPAGALEGSSRRATFNQSRDTILDNAHEEGVRWVRHARSGACGFCRMLATRVLTESRAAAPGLYRSEGSASRNAHQKNAIGHDFCRCIILPLRDGAEYVVPDYLPQWLDDYDAVAYGPDDRLLPAWKIAERMEARGLERGEHVGAAKPKPKPRKPAKPEAGPEVVDLDAPAGERAVARLTERSAAVEDAARPVAERVEQARIYAEQADQLVATAARYSGQAKQVVDTADKLLGAQIPVVRNVKAIVDAADKTLQTANQVTNGVVQVAKVAEVAIADTVAIANGAVQVATEAAAVLDEVTAIAVGARQLVGDTAQAIRDTAADAKAAPRAFAGRLANEVGDAINSTVRDFEKDVRGVRSVADATNLVDNGLDTAAQNLTDRLGAAFDAAIGELNSRIATAADRAAKIQADGAGLVGRARGLGDQVQGVAGSVAELGEVAQRPLQDVRALAQTVRDVASDVEQAGADAAETTRQVRRLVDAVNDWRAAQRVADELPELPAGPVRVRSERLDQPARQLPAGDQPARVPAVVEDQAPAVRPPATSGRPAPIRVHSERLDIEPNAIEAPSKQLALARAPEPLPIEARAPLMLEAGPSARAVPRPTEGQIAEWLAAEDEHFAALEAWRAAEILEPLPAETVVADLAETLAPARTKGDQLREALAEAERIRELPDDRVSASARKRAQRNDYNREQVRKARAELDAAIADGSVDDVLAAPTPKRAKSRPFAEVEAEKRVAADAEIQTAIDDFEAAVATGDDDLITQTCDHMEALEKAEAARRVETDAQLAKIAEKHERQRARRAAAAEDEQRAIYDEMGRILEGDENPSNSTLQFAEAQATAKVTGKDEGRLLENIRKRDWLRTAEGGSTGESFESVLRTNFRYEVHKAYMLAEEECRGAMLSKAGQRAKFDPVNLWYCAEGTARKMMSEEMANWFDGNGRITLPVMRAMILDGDENFAGRTVLTADFLQ